MKTADLTLSLLGGKSVFSDQQMLAVFFFYGLGFMILAAVTFFKKAKIIDVDLTHSFYFLGAFGLTHGLAEWIDVGRLWIKISSGTTIPLLDGMKIFFMTISFILLMQFGLNLLTLRREKYAWTRQLPLAAAIIFFVATFVTGTFMDSELIARYAFGFTGALLTTFAFLEIRKIAQASKLDSLVFGSTLMAAAFGVYTIFGGLITFVIAGIPPQVVRMLCACLVACAAFSLLTVLRVGLEKKGKDRPKTAGK